MPMNPGSPEAYKQGCRCAILDNNHGRGDGPFWISGDCPVHALPPPSSEALMFHGKPIEWAHDPNSCEVCKAAVAEATAKEGE